MADKKTHNETFVESVAKLDTGELAQLRRGCGRRDPVDGRCPWLITYMQGFAAQPAAFLAASLMAQYKTADIKQGRHKAKGNFGKTWKKAVQGNSSKSIQRRFTILLDADYNPMTGEGDLPYRLRQMVKYAASNGVGIDWAEFVKHIANWNSQDKWVQKECARAFFSDDKTQAQENETEE